MKWMGEEEAKEIKGAMMTSGGKGKEGKEKKWKEKEGETPLMGTLCITRERGRAAAFFSLIWRVASLDLTLPLLCLRRRGTYANSLGRSVRTAKVLCRPLSL